LAVTGLESCQGAESATTRGAPDPAGLHAVLPAL